MFSIRWGSFRFELNVNDFVVVAVGFSGDDTVYVYVCGGIFFDFIRIVNAMALVMFLFLCCWNRL